MKEVVSSRQRWIVEHSNWFEPESWLRWIHFDGFTADWEELGLTDEDLNILQIQIMIAPKLAPVIPGTGGVRKVRFSPPSSRKGKRGGIRVLYAVFGDYGVGVLAAAYRKGVKDDITSAEKKMLKKIIASINKQLEHPRRADAP